MSSLKQIEANRRNALKSTGPKTPEGKRRSRCNALRHGLTAETVIATLEDAGDYQAFVAAVIADYDAASAVERELVLRLASVLWRLRRATGIETALFEAVTEESRKHEHRLSCENLGGAADLSERNRLLLGVARESDAAAANALSSDSKKHIADCFLRLAELPNSPPRSPQPLRTHAVAASATDCVYAGVVAAPKARADPFNLSILVPATRARRVVRRVQVTTREVNAKRADQLRDVTAR
jgi:hypothetical protein